MSENYDYIVQDINNIFEHIKNSYTNLSPFMSNVSGKIQGAIQKNFYSSGNYNGASNDINILSGGNQRWRPLSQKTLDNYRKRGIKHNSTLRNSGTLLKSIRVAPVASTTIGISVGVNYGAIHNFGGIINTTVQVSEFKRLISQAFGKPIQPKKITVKAHSRKMNTVIPARPFITLTPEDFEDIKDTLLELLRIK